MTPIQDSKQTEDSNSSEAPKKPREEAQLRSWAELTKGQQDAVKGIHEWLQGFYDQAEAHDKKAAKQDTELGCRFLPKIDKTRPSNVILIDGDRGSGKSTVLVFLLQLWKSHFLRGPQDGLKELQIPSNGDGSAIATALGKTSVIPLQQLDLQPLPSSASILTWLARRLYDVLEGLPSGDTAQRGAPCSGPPWGAGSDQEPRSRKSWRGFLDAASRWNGNLTERKGHLDPEDYALELDQAVRSHLDLSRRWGELVDELVHDAKNSYDRHLQSKPILLLPIDDADMNPHLCVQLLDFVRMLWHRRLVILLTGESRLFQEVLRYHYLGALTKPLGSIQGPPRSRDLFGAEEKAARLARVKYDSVVPASHRFALEGPALEEIAKNLANRSLDESFEKRHDLVRFLNEATRPAIPAALRDLTDLDQWLAGRPTPSSERAAKHLWDFAIENPALTDEQRHLLREVVSIEDGQLRIQFGGLQICPRSQVSYFQKTSNGGRLKIGRFDSFAFEQLDLRPEVEKPIIAALALAGEIVSCIDAPRHLDSQVLAERLAYSFPAVAIAWPSEKVFLADETFPWPLPKWKPFTKWLIFGGHWNRIMGRRRIDEFVREAKDEKEAKARADAIPGALADCFCRLVHAVQHGLPQEVDLIDKADLGKLGENLWKWIRDSRRSTDQDLQAFLDWAGTMAIMLAAPESGLRDEDAQAMCTGWKKAWKAQWDPERATLVPLMQLAINERVERAISALGCKREDAPKILERYDLIDNGKWKKSMEAMRSEEVGRKKSNR